ncbi:gluconokinase [Paludifilum halophilum]|uniref:Gluconate kinase n=1 Tax=Paludifilum halophilum TaxID=1642702 RepID=A0A235B748_9BACL|nr:FGGY family carbohydrate kinase [Paludifilum halophilum]OYD08124.1 gluconate kinase [Paludifilum halophilum]
MKETNVVIGLDIGTTSTKAVVFGPFGRIQGSCSVGYDLVHPRPSWAEQEPEEILSAAAEALRKALEQSGADGNQVTAVGVSSAMHSLLALDESGRPLTRSIIWADSRSIEQTKKIRRDLGGKALYRRTGTPIHPMSPLSKLLWMREENPTLFHSAAKFISIKEYLFFRLFGQYVVDTSIASATGLFNLEKSDWDEKALTIAGINREQLSTIVPTTHVVEGLDPDWAETMGLPTDTPWVVGASDGVLANLGVGAIDPGEMAVTIGTSAAVRAVTDRPRTDESERTFCYALTEKHWVIGGPANNGGILLRWLRDEFASPESEVAARLEKDPYDLMLQYAEKVPAGSEGLLFLPFLAGERAPYWNANARGSFFGIGLHHKREHFIRAVLEGVSISVFSIGIALRELAGPARDIRASGGFSRSPLWRQILCDVMGRELVIPETGEASALGAAVLALYGLGAIDDLSEVKEWIRIQHRHQPNLSDTETYLNLYYMYERLYRKLKDEFDVIAHFQRTGHF